MKRLLLIGNPNVGKSVFFSRLTGTQVVSSNYPGTTVEFTKGFALIAGEKYEVVDVPGTYTLEPTCKAEEVACQLLQTAAQDEDVIINIVDATNLERNLNLTLQLMEGDIPVIVALNMWDDTKHKGIVIDVPALEEWLGVPVVPTSAVTGQGFLSLISRLRQARTPKVHRHSLTDRWKDIGELVRRVQKLEHRHHTIWEWLEDKTIQPWSGIPLAAIFAFFSFLLIRFIGENLITYLADPFFKEIWAPWLMRWSAWLGSGGLWHDLLIGHLINGAIDYVQSFGVLSTALYVEFAMVLPYIIAFYLVLGILEDSGYLPRLAVLMDNLMHRFGLHGFAIVPTLLAFGCNVPGILATRVLESRRERFIASTLISIGVPCAALQAMIIGVLGAYGVWPFLVVYLTLAATWVVLGTLLNRFIPGFSPELLLEIPPYRFPPPRILFRKTWWRIKLFIKEALPIVMAGVLLVNLLYLLKVFDLIAYLAAPVISGILGLPKEAVIALVIGFLRKDVAVGMLVPLSLSVNQLIVAVVFLSMSFPCVATFVVLIKELGWRDMLKATGVMIVASLLVGGALNLLLNFTSSLA